MPIGARVPTKNPNRFEVDPQPEPDQATWAKLSITVERSDGGIVDAEIIRPSSWILANGLCAGRMLPLNLPELEVSGLALVTAIDDCPPIADGEGSVVTARFVTREVHVVASVDVLGADGTVETITGTTIHPVWSVDRQSWVPLAELAQGERLYCDTESFGLGFPSSLSPKASGLVLSVSLSRVSQPVYNIEVHGEHVYQVGEMGVLVHNGNPADCPLESVNAPRGTTHPDFPNSTQIEWGEGLSALAKTRRTSGGVRHGANVAVFEYVENGISKTKLFKSARLPDGTSLHSEVAGGIWLKKMGFDPGDVKRVYSEFHPCTDCNPFVRAQYPNATIEFSWPYKTPRSPLSALGREAKNAAIGGR